MIKDVRRSEVIAGHFMVLCQCVPDDIKEEHKVALFGQADSVPRLKLKRPLEYKKFYTVLPCLWYT
jgi:hypothetical protein